MNADADTITLALALTAGGAVIFAGLTTGLVQLLKGVASGVVSGHEQTLAFVISAVWVILAMVSGIQAGALTLTIESGFLGFLAWYGIARIAMGIHDDVTQAPTAVGKNL